LVLEDGGYFLLSGDAEAAAKSDTTQTKETCFLKKPGFCGTVRHSGMAK